MTPLSCNKARLCVLLGRCLHRPILRFEHSNAANNLALVGTRLGHLFLSLECCMVCHVAAIFMHTLVMKLRAPLC